MISVLILTLNEEVNLLDCIASLPWQEDIWVLDSMSDDRTVEYAASVGANVVKRAFTNYSDQRNFGLSLPRGHWIVMIDADERITPDLAAEIENTIDNAPLNLTMLRVRRKDFFMGKWIRRSSAYPTWFPRVFRRGSVQVERAINEVYTTPGDVGHLKEHLVHFPFSKGVDWWFERHNRYSTSEATVLAAQEKAAEGFRLADFFAADFSRRRSARKRVLYAMPFRPFIVFAYLFFMRLGFLDGRAGYHYASMRLAYEIMIDSKKFYCRASGDSR